MSRARVTRTTPAGDAHQVLRVEGPSDGYQRQPCRDCPWRVDATGVFPPEAFLASAHTSYDAALEQFACHSSLSARDRDGDALRRGPRTCAGFLLRGATHNLGARLAQSKGGPFQVTDGGHALHPTYRAMAVANGVPEDHPRLAACRDDV